MVYDNKTFKSKINLRKLERDVAKGLEHMFKEFSEDELIKAARFGIVLTTATVDGRDPVYEAFKKCAIQVTLDAIGKEYDSYRKSK
ncbi:hypothetical protein J4423_01420 [Candidatus Pacearchaeota archaeon]|nr:hypothetical protein [Candidatus Pacearchaeota archaeon]